MAFYGRPSLPFASPKTLQTPKTPKRPLQWLLIGFQRRQKSTSIAFYGHPSIQACRLPPVKRSKPLKPLKGHFNGFFWASSAGESLRPWLFMGVQACRLPALQRSKLPKPHFNGFLWASSAGKSYPKARSIAVSGRSSVPFARHLQPTGIPRPLQWFLMDFQRRQKLPQGQIHCFFWAVQRPVGQALAANRHPKATSMAFYGRPSYPSKARSVPQCHAASVWKNVHFLAFWLAFEICFIGISERANGPRPSCPSRSFPSFTAMLLKRGEGAFSRAGSCSRHSEGDLMPSDRAVARSLPSFTAMLLRRGEGFCLRAGGAFVSLLAGL